MSISNSGVIKEEKVIFGDLTVLKCCYKWEVHNPMGYIIQRHDILSPAFTITGYDKHQWRLSISTERYDNDSYLKLTVHSGIEPHQALISCQCSIMSKYGLKKSSDTSRMQQVGRNVSMYIIPTSKIHDDESWTVDNTMIILCDIDVVITSDNINEIYATTIELSDDMKHLLESQKDADITVAVGSKTFQAHKVILAARSPVLLAMLEHEMRENEESQVNIMDITEEVFEELLRYIYTGKIPNISVMAINLLDAAEKYELMNLKLLCTMNLSKNINLENAAEMLRIADLYGIEQLKVNVCHLIKDHMKEFIRTEGYIQLRNFHPELAHNLLEEIISM